MHVRFNSDSPLPKKFHVAMVTVQQFNMAAVDKTTRAPYPSEKQVKKALDTLKPSGILSKVCKHLSLARNRNIIPTVMFDLQIIYECFCLATQAYDQFQLKRYEVGLYWLFIC